jgi:CubicO group peptidase (beta-lactamase class C family)
MSVTNEALPQNLDVCREAAGVPGAAVGYVSREKLICAASGVTRANSTSAVRPDSIFEAASLSKQLLVYVVLQMADSGVLDIDASASSLVDASDLARSQWSSLSRLEGFSTISVRNILSHSTGLPNWLPPEGIRRLLFQPGRYFQYSGLSYIFLQWILEQRLRKVWQEIACEYVFSPLKMIHSGFKWQDSWEEADLVHGHRADGVAVEKARQVPGEAAGGLLTSAQDYGVFLKEFLQKIENQGSAFSQVCVPQIGRFFGIMPSSRPWPIAWGLGMGLEFHRGDTLLWQVGANPFFYNWAIGNPRTQNALVVLTNSGPGHPLLRNYISSVFIDGLQCFDFDQTYLKDHS